MSIQKQHQNTKIAEDRDDRLIDRINHLKQQIIAIRRQRENTENPTEYLTLGKLIEEKQEQLNELEAAEHQP